MGHWHKDFEAEQIMTSIGMKYTYVESFPIKSIKLKDSKQLNARFDAAADIGMVQDYASKMKANIVFPAIVVEEETGRVLAGVHRLTSAISAGFTVISVYLVKGATQAQVDKFVRLDNCRHGKGLTEKERIASCVRLHQQYKYAITALNEEFFSGKNETYEKIVTAIHAATVENKLIGLCVPVLGSMTRTSLQAMHPIVDNNNVLAAVGKLVHEYDLPISQIQEVVKEVRRCGTEDSQLELVKEKRQELYEESKKSSTVTPKPEKDLTKTVVNFKKFLETGFSGKPFPPVEKFVTDPAQQKTIKEAITDICDLLKTLKQKVR